MKKNNNKKIRFLLITIIGLITFVFFLKIHPIIILDADDWWYISLGRNAIPLWGYWNPTRVLPETLAPLVSALAVYIIMPFNKDYITSLALMNALVVTLFIVLYIYCFVKLIRTKLKTNIYNTINLTIIFYLLHFLIFRHEYSNNLYMFYSVDAICYYYYLIPSLLNCSLVMYFIADDTFNKHNSIIKISILILMVYLAIFSNAFQSIILAVYIASTLIKPTIELINYKTKNNFISYIKNNKYQYIILFMWLVSQFFEINGGRSDSLTRNESFISKLNTSITMFNSLLSQFNKLFIIILLGIIIIGIYFYIKDKLYKKMIIHEVSFSFLFTTLYLLLLCTVSVPTYSSRVDAVYGIFFYIFIFIIFTIGYFIYKYPNIVILFPLCIYIMFFNIYTVSKTFAESNTLNISPSDCIEIDNIIINQIKLHVDNGDKKMTLYIPKFSRDDNWPIALYGLGRIPASLYKHGIIKHYIEIEDYKYANELYSHLDIFN